MAESPAPPGPAAPPRPGASGRVAWWIGWVLLAAASMSLTYGALVLAGR